MGRLTKKINSGYVLVDDKGMGVCTGCEATDKLGKYEDLEEQIGCPLEVRCSLDIHDRVIDMFGIEYIVRSIGKEDFIAYDVKKMKKNEIYRELFKWKEYKITWWLKADKSE